MTKSHMIIFFYKPHAKNGWLSNFSSHTITEANRVFPTAEHYLMYHKAFLMNDKITANRILRARTPSLAKRLGRSVLNFNQELWDQHKQTIMLRALSLKVDQHEEIKHLLRNTGESLIAEASPMDSIWGIGMDINNKDIEHPDLWKGQNLLGIAWMKVRDNLVSLPPPPITQD